jgi:hypothetical protein
VTGGVWVGHCVVCLGQRWMTAETRNDPCGLCQMAAERAAAVEDDEDDEDDEEAPS